MENKSWCNAELVLYPENMDMMIKSLNSGWVKKWAWILHDKDYDRKPHIHLMCSWGRKPTKTSVIMNKMGIRENQIERIKGTWADALDYLTHRNAPEKYQYDEEEVHSNFDWEEEAKNSKHNRQSKLKEVLEKIGTGEIRQYNITEYIPDVNDYVRYYNQISRAFKWRDSYVMAHLEELVKMKNVCWIYGEPGTGKTLFAKQLSKTAGFFYRITSTGKNLFDEYQDEPCIIIDDLRPEDIDFTSLLGILDPYNFKAAAARYKNKNLQTQMVIVTSTISPETYYSASTSDSKIVEDAWQLYRRISYVYEVKADRIEEYEYNNATKKREYTKQWPNFLLQMMEREDKKRTSSLVDRLMEGAMDSMSMATA